MSLLTELREDMRLARLNNPGYGVLFRLMDIALGLFKLCVLAAFGLGIWHIIYGINVADSKKNLGQFAEALKSQSVASATQNSNDAELTPERIEMLRQFARANRETGVADNSVGGVPDNAVVIGSVPNTDALEVGGVTANQQASNTRIEPSLDLQSDGLFEALEKKLLPAASRGDDAITALPEVPLTVSEPVNADNVLAGASAIAASPPVIDSPQVPTESQVAAKPLAEAPGAELKNEKWLLAQNTDHYVIQIGSTTNQPFLVRFARLLPDDQPKAIFHYIFNKKPEYGLSFGLFETKAQANAALEQLSQKARRYGAFARKISIIHQQIDELADKVALAQ